MKVWNFIETGFNALIIAIIITFVIAFDVSVIRTDFFPFGKSFFVPRFFTIVFSGLIAFLIVGFFQLG